MANDLQDNWNDSLQLIRVASEEELAVVELVDFTQIAFQTIQPDARFLFRKTIDLKIKIEIPTVTRSAVDAAASISISPDPFAIIHFMPDLQDLELLLDKSVKRIDRFTPLLPELQRLHISFSEDVEAEQVEFGPTAFDHLIGLNKLSLGRHEDRLLGMFETGLAPRSINFYGCKRLKLNSAAVTNIEEITMDYGMVESMHPLSGLKILHITPDETTDLSTLFRQCTRLEVLKIYLSDLSLVDRGLFSCLSELKSLALCCNETFTEGKVFIEMIKIFLFINLKEIFH
jgi:hypothetical protein